MIVEYQKGKKKIRLIPVDGHEEASLYEISYYLEKDGIEFKHENNVLELILQHTPTRDIVP